VAPLPAPPVPVPPVPPLLLVEPLVESVSLVLVELVVLVGELLLGVDAPPLAAAVASGSAE
jgi:hypothetical protein